MEMWFRCGCGDNGFKSELVFLVSGFIYLSFQRSSISLISIHLGRFLTTYVRFGFSVLQSCTNAVCFVLNAFSDIMQGGIIISAAIRGHNSRLFFQRC
jgi:hypothetical protein